MVNKVDIIVGAAWGDEGKGKICYRMAPNYDYVCRFNGGPNAGHTIWHEGTKIVTHIIPTGIVHGKKCVIGPNCLINIDKFYKEIEYLNSLGFDTDLVQVHPSAHAILDKHIEADQALKAKIGTTGQGIGPCVSDKMMRLGTQIKDLIDPKYIWDGFLSGNILCEGAQSVWLDINQGEYPYVTASECMPYSACSIGFSPKKIDRIISVAKMYDTRSGFDSYFGRPEDMDETMLELASLGEEFGSTTGRPRTCKWLNLDKLIKSLEISGATTLVLNKGDILKKLGKFVLVHLGETVHFRSLEDMCGYLSDRINIEVIYDFNK